MWNLLLENDKHFFGLFFLLYMFEIITLSTSLGVHSLKKINGLEKHHEVVDPVGLVFIWVLEVSRERVWCWNRRQVDFEDCWRWWRVLQINGKVIRFARVYEYWQLIPFSFSELDKIEDEDEFYKALERWFCQKSHILKKKTIRCQACQIEN